MAHFNPRKHRMSPKKQRQCERAELARRDKNSKSYAGQQEAKPLRRRKKNADGEWVIIEQ